MMLVSFLISDIMRSGETQSCNALTSDHLVNLVEAAGEAEPEFGR